MAIKKTVIEITHDDELRSSDEILEIVAEVFQDDYTNEDYRVSKLVAGKSIVKIDPPTIEYSARIRFQGWSSDELYDKLSEAGFDVLCVDNY